MPQPPPHIDPRTYADLVAQTEWLAEHFSDWQAPPEGQTDAGRALIRIFGRMAAMVSDRLNRVPEKHFLAFLNLIGVQQHPPRPARVPLTVYLVDDSPEDAFVPAHTQVAALPQPDETEEVLFETEQDLVVVRSQLQAAVIHHEGQYCDQIATAASSTGSFPVFNIESPNSLYVAAEQLTTQPDSGEIKLKISDEFQRRMRGSVSLVEGWTWQYWNGETWADLSARISSPDISFGTDDQAFSVTELTLALTGDPPQPNTIEGIEAQWLRGIAPDGTFLPDIRDGEVSLVRPSLTEQPPDQAFFNAEDIDLSKDFFPLGETPQFNDTLYLASQECLHLPGAEVTLTFEHSSGITPKPSSGLSLGWEIWAGDKWESVLTTKTKARNKNNDWSSPKSFIVPDGVAPIEINGEENYWLRARLIAGNYGVEPRFETRITTKKSDDAKETTETETKTVQVDGTGYFPPRLKSITLTRSNLEVSPKRLLSALPSGAFIHADAGTPTDDPALHLRFDRSFPNRSMALYLQVAPPEPGELRQAEPVDTPAKLQWEYSTANGWQPLSVTDGTQTLTQRGMIQFIGPANLAEQTVFGQSGYWLRLRWREGNFPIMPRLQRVLTNTIWAVQAVTQEDEILGSGTGDPNLVFNTLQTPVLPGQQLMVREPELPPPDEQAMIKQLEGEDAITITTDEAGQPADIWIRWHQVSDFYGSGSRDRHYTLDPMTGEIRFGGDGQGLAPPQGRNNIRLARYRAGGGYPGNRQAETLTELKTTLPFVDRVTNHEPASGGADVEPIAAVQESGPKQLRHRDRAVTAQDIDDLTHAASSEVARVKVITPQFRSSTSETSGLQWLPVYPLTIETAGQIQVRVTPNNLRNRVIITLYGPGQSTPKQLSADGALDYDVTAEDLEWGTLWRVELAQTEAAGQQNLKGQVTLTTPTETTEFEFDLPPHHHFTEGFIDAGTVKVIIVPHSWALQPTPSLALIEQVQRFLVDRLSPTLSLTVTEPPWVRVSVEATVVPTSLAAANTLADEVDDAITTFLHPLTGGPRHRGWPFGRRPHHSNLYTLIERLPGVNFVTSLRVVSTPSLGRRREDDSTLSLIADEDRDRFLIYSGQHQITIDAPT